MDKNHKDPEKLTRVYHVERNTCITHGRNSKTRNIGLILILQFGKDWHSIRLDRMQSSFKKHFQLIVFQKLYGWRLEKSCMRKHTCHLDHHQRSRYVTIVLEEKFHWVLQFINNQKDKLFDSHKKKLADEQNSSNQPNQSQSQSVIDQGNLITRKTCLSLRWHKRTKRCFWSTSWNCVTQHGQWVNSWSHRGGHRLQHSRTTTFYCEAIAECQRSRIDSENREPPAQTCSSTRPTTKSIILIPSVKNQNKWFMKLGTSNCVNYSTWNPKRNARYVYHTGTSASSTARAGTSCEKGTEENKKFIQYTMDLFSIPDCYIKKGRPHGHRYGQKPGDKEYYIAHQLKKKCKKY